ncbi:MAG: YgdI/YgdR family lipoprotein [Verrucomicrobiales bacterium]|jgi:hypothetical protein
MTKIGLGLGGVICLVLASCASSPSCVITMKDGRKISARDWPSLDDATGYYSGEAQGGDSFVIRESQVASVVNAREQD